ncbi:MAG: cytochrome-c peroxidase [Flavobacteriales bacterium]|nr:cytochrome-c peroxidase [Flavobacteriales bacterium]
MPASSKGGVGYFIMKAFLSILGISLVVTFSSCKKKEPTIEVAKEVSFYQPEYFPTPEYPVDQYPVTTAGFELGKDLFYSTLLSSDNTISCASCHAQTHQFADHNVALSVGVGGLTGTRNAPAIFNMAWQPYFMWDGGVNHLDMFHLAPITSPVEMNETIPGILEKLNNSQEWKAKFANAFGVSEVTDYELFKALSQFVLMITSDQSLYDDVQRGKAVFDADQQAGYDVFLAKCASCHTEPLFTNYAFINNGLDQAPADSGRFRITQNPVDFGKFKVPTLRNVLFTYPYMHDGRFFTIDQVLDHYDHGIVASPTLAPELSNGIPISDTERFQLKKFLETLNDYELLSSELIAEP